MKSRIIVPDASIKSTLQLDPGIETDDDARADAVSIGGPMVIAELERLIENEGKLFAHQLRARVHEIRRELEHNDG